METKPGRGSGRAGSGSNRRAAGGLGMTNPKTPGFPGNDRRTWLWLVLLVVMVTLWLARRSDRSRNVSRRLGQTLGWVAAIWSLFVAVAATVA